MNSLRVQFGVVSERGTDKFQHVLRYFIQAISKESSDAELDPAALDWTKASRGDCLRLQAFLDHFWSIVSHLPKGREEDSPFWIEAIYTILLSRKHGPVLDSEPRTGP